MLASCRPQHEATDIREKDFSFNASAAIPIPAWSNTKLRRFSMELNCTLHVMRGRSSQAFAQTAYTCLRYPRIHPLRKMDCIASRVYLICASYTRPQVGNIRLAGVKPGNDNGDVLYDREQHWCPDSEVRVFPRHPVRELRMEGRSRVPSTMIDNATMIVPRVLRALACGQNGREFGTRQ
jgi:hypothetical protein